jgi:cytochrome d ubiquinol oxidase subunit II
MDLETIWYGVIGISMIMYTVLDGFDLGVGALHLFARNDYERRVFLNSIGPVWDGNEVWIVIIMGGLLAGFPNAYATIFSGFYTLLMFLIAGLMFRAVAIEFRSKTDSKTWRQIWDVIFCVSSVLTGIVIGVVLGNLILGIPLNETQDYHGGLMELLNPYSLLVGVTGMSLFAMHGAIYLTMKTEGESQEVVRHWINRAIFVFLFFYSLTTIITVFYQPHMTMRIQEHPIFLLVPILAFLCILNIPFQVRKHNDGWAFIFSCLSIALLVGLFGLGTYPYLVYSTMEPDIYSLTIYNAVSSKKTLQNLLVVVGIGIPLVLAYGFWVYRIFRGKVKLEHTSY